MTKRPWCIKYASNRGTIYTASAPWECVSMDHMESRTPGFITQLKGKPTKNCYCAATIFLDHHSDLNYVPLQRGLSLVEMAQSKKAFEDYAKTHRAIIRNYHADNGRFSNNPLPQEVAQENQTTIYCGVNYHLQNGKAEKRIIDLQEHTRKQLHHTKAKCQSTVELVLCPYTPHQDTHLHKLTGWQGICALITREVLKYHCLPQTQGRPLLWVTYLRSQEPPIRRRKSTQV